MQPTSPHSKLTTPYYRDADHLFTHWSRLAHIPIIHYGLIKPTSPGQVDRHGRVPIAVERLMAVAPALFKVLVSDCAEGRPDKKENAGPHSLWSTRRPHAASRHGDKKESKGQCSWKSNKLIPTPQSPKTGTHVRSCSLFPGELAASGASLWRRHPTANAQRGRCWSAFVHWPLAPELSSRTLRVTDTRPQTWASP